MKKSNYEIGCVSHTDSNPYPADNHRDLKLKAIEIASGTRGQNAETVRLGLEAAAIVNDDAHSRASWYQRWRNSLGIDLHDHDPVFPRVPAGIGMAARTLAFMEDRLAHGKVHPSWLAIGKGISGELAHTVLLGDWEAGSKIDEVFREFPDSSELEDVGFEVVNRYEKKSTAPKHYRLRSGGGIDGLPRYLAINRLRAAADLISPRGDHYQLIKRASFVLNLPNLDISVREQLSDAIHRRPDGKLWDDLGQQIVEPVLDEPQLRMNETIRPGSVVYFALRRHDATGVDTHR